MAVVEVKTFKDIQDAILRRGKIEDTSENRTSIKEYINTAYFKLVREKAYRWSGNTMPIRLRGKYTTGTITATNGSDEITGDATVWVENDHRFSKMRIVGSNAIFKILRVASNTAITLDQYWVDTTGASKSYSIFKDEYGLFPDFQDIRKLRIPGLSPSQQPKPISPEKMDMLRDSMPFREGTPKYYTIFSKAIYTEKTWATFNLGTDFWENDLDDTPINDALVVWPGIMTADRVALARYTMKPYPMGADTDEPWIPTEDRIVLVYDVLTERFLANRDIATKREWAGMLKDIKKKMSADIETTDDELIFTIDKSQYRRHKWIEDEDEVASL